MAGESARDVARRQRAKAARLERSAELWERGAQGEAETAAALRELTRRGWTAFHDVRWPGRQRANIDHVVVGPTGVFVIDTKNWSGDIRVVNNVLHQGRWRRESEVASAAEAALSITRLLHGLPATPVLCFVGTELPAGWARDVLVCSTRNLAETLAAQPPVLRGESLRRATALLQSQLQSATRPTPTRRIQRRRPTPPPRKPPRAARGLTRLAVGLGALVMTLIAGAIALSLMLNVLGSLGQGLVSNNSSDREGASTQTESAAVLGDNVHLSASASHPPLRVRADKVIRVATTRPDYPLQQGHHLIGVRYAITNKGKQLWGASSPYLMFSALASSGSHARRGYYGDLPAKRLMPGAFNLRPGKAKRGIVLFSVPNGSKLVRVSLQTGFGSGDGAEWLIP